ncbi:hypothetical protein C3F09_08235 [candidate division GN15 bacterium]|uniref:Cytochrome c-552/4 domain-containing protein n=1 Tax=candidate division GN15 bacterium TaxID=2072418 RepID=A0A855X088_9BACT|nr:MAG: hypothetical protein C3F09_08235 [candidate division GN15 bacterium]
MNRAKLLVTILALALLFVWGCERKVVNEIVTQPSVLPGAEVCMECHGDSDLKLVAAQAQWERSKHGEGELTFLDVNFGEGPTCEGCHTAEGYLSRITGTQFDSSHYSPIGCFTCHAPHTNGTLALRVNSAVTLGNGVSFDRGAADLCVSCHHSRRNVNTYVADSVKLSTHYGPHYSVQGDMLIGTGGYEYAGYTYENSPHQHVAADGCIDCHMSPSVGVFLGGHTWNMVATIEGEEAENLVGCNVQTCHNGERTAFDQDNVQTDLGALLDSLGQALFDAGIVDGTYTPVGDLIVKSRDTVGALYNFAFVADDRSEGIHNTAYAMGLLRSSLNFLLYHDPNGSVGAPALKTIASH